MLKAKNHLILLVVSIVCVSTAQSEFASIPDVPFVQEYHLAHSISEEPGANDVRTIAVDNEGTVWAGTAAGLFALEKGESGWDRKTEGSEAGPVYDVMVDSIGTVWVGAWDGVFRASPQGLKGIPSINHPIAALCEDREGSIVCLGPDGMWKTDGESTTPHPLPCSRNIRAVIPGQCGDLWIATGMGLSHHTPDGDRLYQQNDEILTADLEDVAFAGDGKLWAGGFGGVSVYNEGHLEQMITPADGLPTVEVQSVALGPENTMWVGTSHGVARYDGKGWSLRHSRRWLVDDDVRDVAFDSEGTAWVATAGGVSAIARKTMTLAEKADYFLDVLYKRHVREPWFVEKCRLPTPGDISVWEPEDDDNDGEYTGNYLVMESFRYATTNDPEARRNANRAFEALRYLETVNGIPGFVARTVIPATWDHMHDPNRTYTDRERTEVRVRDPRYKPVETRWHPTPDGKWLWKGDTSSDEITGHFFAYLYYYDLVAEGEERETVRDHVRRIMDYIIDHGYVLVGADGTHTRWGVWSPEKLNGDPDWRAERGVNAAEILSYLKVSFHITGDEKYQKEYLRLIEDHGYALHSRHAKTYARGWNTHIDDSLLVEAFPGLLRCERDPGLVALYRSSLDHWYTGIRHEMSPFFNFIYGSLTGRDPEILDSVEFLRDTPLDLINWRIDNSKREDLRPVRAPLLEAISTDRLLPPSERGVVRWDKNPWRIVQGDGGHTEWAPTFWLMPYWMGRYYGFLEGPN